jgi:UDP-glucose 4-epimerase
VPSCYPLRQAQVVYYLASSINPTLGELYPDRAVADHLHFSKLLDRLSRLPSPPVVVLTSSGGTVYDEQAAPPYGETDPVAPNGRYGAAKLRLEEELQRWSDRVPGVVLRLANAYGPGQSTGKGQGVLAYWLRAVRDGKPLQIIGTPDCVRDYVYVDDVVDLMRRIAEPEHLGRIRESAEPVVLNVGSGVPTTLLQLSRVVAAVVGHQPRLERLPGRALDRRHVWLRVDRAREVLDWRPSTPLFTGVARMWREMSTPADPANR